ncbi:chitin synthase-domain-containing protein [Gorgonomyces haynaldii]|nr:chitin synthase-domain-containing protein [Gorgonomyces haynaldii]
MRSGKDGKTVELPDKRLIGYMDYKYGNCSETLLMIPGLPGCRLFNPILKSQGLDLRVIVVERPGLGLSTPVDNLSFLSFSQDLAHFLDALEIQDVLLIGYSAGGPFSIAFAYKYPHRVRRMAIVSSVSPRIGIKAYFGMPMMYKLAWFSTKHLHSLLSVVCKMNEEECLKDPVGHFREGLKLQCESDRRIQVVPEIQQLFIDSEMELASRHQYPAICYEFTLWGQDWGFQLSDIKHPHISVWHGALDSGTTIQMGRHIASEIGCPIFEFSDLGHMLLFDQMDDPSQSHIVQNMNVESNAEEPSPFAQPKQQKRRSQAPAQSKRSSTYNLPAQQAPPRSYVYTQQPQSKVQYQPFEQAHQSQRQPQMTQAPPSVNQQQEQLRKRIPLPQDDRTPVGSPRQHRASYIVPLQKEEDETLLLKVRPQARFGEDQEVNLRRRGTNQSGGGTLSRKRTLTRPARPEDNPTISRSKKNILLPEKDLDKTWFHPWRFFSQMVTCCIPGFCLDKCGKHSASVQQAWREKVALCLISAILCALLGFLTYGFQSTMCVKLPDKFNFKDFKGIDRPHMVSIRGKVYDMTSYLPTHSNLPTMKLQPQSANDLINAATGVDATPYFPAALSTTCQTLLAGSFAVICAGPGFPGIAKCHNPNTVQPLLNPLLKGSLYYDWENITTNNVVYNNNVLDMTRFFSSNASIFGPSIDNAVRGHRGKDMTKALQTIKDGAQAGDCLAELFTIGSVDSDTIGCFFSQVVLVISLIIVGALIIVRFLFAMWFQWFISNELGKLEANVQARKPTRRADIQQGKFAIAMSDNAGKIHVQESTVVGVPTSQTTLSRRFGTIKSKSTYGHEIHTIMLVTCYSEDREGIKNTFDSLAMTDYNEDFKLLFIVADGIIKGSGNTETTPDIILSLLERDENWPEPMAFSYQAVGEGSKALNYAKVYVAWYNHQGRSVPAILIVKVGAPSEANAAKPGNRGKRDSQIMLMRFLERVTFNERLCPFEYDLFQKMHYLMGVTPDHFEIVLMVDADTKVAPDSLARMVACMARDPLVMGLCGETRIANKSDSYISRIQVFEYYLSHHMLKAFESCFGGVTCLPGCFSMYRIKCPKEDGWVPILASPDIVSIYSQSVVDTLHKKNLLLLGEDRFLTTMMLRTFPKRKLIFVPRAFCKTTVPNTFKVLLSQRRRWINSTIHNLMELVLVDELCGIFCFSMQFAIFLELIGTVTLPAAILVLIAVSIVGPVQWLPLSLLLAILGLPAVLILFTTKRVVYVYWMLVYLTGLPIWNFVLPTYAFWHFDDFSWGETRKVEGESAKDGHGENDGSKINENDIPLKRWEEWERERRMHIIQQHQQLNADMRRISRR